MTCNYCKGSGKIQGIFSFSQGWDCECISSNKPSISLNEKKRISLAKAFNYFWEKDGLGKCVHCQREFGEHKGEKCLDQNLDPINGTCFESDEYIIDMSLD